MKTMTSNKALVILFVCYAVLFAIVDHLFLDTTQMMVFIYASVILVGAGVIYVRNTRWWNYPKGPFPREWKSILMQEVSFYKAIEDTEKVKFEKKIMFFLANYDITGVETEVETLDKLLIASSSIIPTFHKPRWKYTNLDEVLLYPRGFSFNLPNTQEKMLMEGLVGGGPLEGKMILSKIALREGFQDETDNHNTAIHEFVHLIDKDDGTVDGIPVSLLSFPLLRKLRTIILEFRINRLFNRTVDDIEKRNTDIRPYGGTNKAEFLSVATEYFFENPVMMKEEHPDLHRLMQQIYRTPESVQRELSKN